MAVKRAPEGWTKELPDEDYLFEQIMLTAECAWHNQLSRDEVERWLSNFTGQFYSRLYERRMALWLLANYVYFGEQEVRHLCRELFDRFLHVIATNHDVGMLPKPQLAMSSHLQDTRFYALGGPSESGGLVLYLFRQENQLRVSAMPESEHIPASVKYLVAVDDATLSGAQAKKYVRQRFRSVRGQREVFLLTFVASPQAVTTLAKSGITVVHCVHLDERSKVFSDASSVFREFKAQALPCREIAYNYGKLLNPKHPLGFDDGQYAFGFFYNTPDNSLPVFWSDNGGWKPIFRRYHKLATGKAKDDFGRFI